MIPDEATLREAYQRARATRLVNDQLEDIVETATEDARTMPIGSNLAERIRRILDEDRTLAWDAAIARVEEDTDDEP